MSIIVKNPVYTHSFSAVERDEDGRWKAMCSCRSFWTEESKASAMAGLHRHLSEHATRLRNLRREVNGNAAHAALPVEMSGDMWEAKCSCGESFIGETKVAANRLRTSHIREAAKAVRRQRRKGSES